MSDVKKYNQIFDYLSTPQLPVSPESTIIFGRQDERVAHAAGDLVLANLVDVAVITGGIGKDSGDLVERGFRSEAHYLEKQLHADAFARHYTLPTIYLDEAARNGGENARNSISILNDNEHNLSHLTAVAHATSARRLAEMLKKEGLGINGAVPEVYVKPTAYDFDATNPTDQDEARAELLRLADWPAKDWLLEQPDLPHDLVEFSRHEQRK